MSLCVAWRWKNEISFASDSCIAQADKSVSDLGIKIATIPVRIVSARDAKTGQIDERFRADYGLAFSGSYLAGYVIREALSEVLSHLQFIATVELMTIERIMKIVHEFHKFYTARLRKSFVFGHDLDFLIGGRCPATGRVKVFKHVASENSDPKYAEVLTDGAFAYTAIGAGEERFKELLEDDLAHPPCQVHFAVFHRLRDVIRDPNIPSVSGSIQTGTFENGEFELLGVMEHDLTGDTPKALPSVRGLVIDEIYEGQNADDFFVHYSFKAPFQGDLEKLFRRGDET
jgi:hypothetical protein